MDETKYIVVIDTNKYSENFERELCAYCTGEVGECGVGIECSELFDEEVSSSPFEDVPIIEHRPDEHGCCRPCAIWPTPGWFNCGGLHLRVDDPKSEEKALKHWIKSRLIDKRKGLELAMKGVPIINNTPDYSTVNDHTINVIIKLQKEIDELKKGKNIKVPQHPAYQSVAIFFYQKPTDEMISLIKNRALDFPKKAHKIYGKDDFMGIKDIKITGFRLLKETTSLSEASI